MALLVTPEDVKTPFDPQTTGLAVGPWDRGEFAAAQAKLKPLNWFYCANCQEAGKLLSDSELPSEFILIAQSLPGGIEQEEIELLRQAAPLARIVIVAGSWCEGELRTGHPPEGVLRMYWHEFANWWANGASSDWSIPLDGPLTCRGSKSIYQPKTSYSVVIHTPTLASFEAISSVLAPLGRGVNWVRSVNELSANITVGIWDGGQLDALELPHLQVFASAISARNGKLIVLLDYPRKQHTELLQQLGCQAVLGKPYVIEELIAACVS